MSSSSNISPINRPKSAARLLPDATGNSAAVSPTTDSKAISPSKSSPALKTPAAARPQSAVGGSRHFAGEKMKTLMQQAAKMIGESFERTEKLKKTAKQQTQVDEEEDDNGEEAEPMDEEDSNEGEVLPTF